MFNAKKSVSGKMNIEKLWSFYEDVSKWCEWDDSIKTVTLNGEFIDGTEGVMYFSDKNIPPLSFVLSNVNKNKGFITSSTVADITVRIIHVIGNEKNELFVEHRIEVTGKNERMVNGIGHALSAQLDQSMEKLKSLAIE